MRAAMVVDVNMANTGGEAAKKHLANLTPL